MEHAGDADSAGSKDRIDAQSRGLLYSGLAERVARCTAVETSWYIAFVTLLNSARPAYIARATIELSVSIHSNVTLITLHFLLELTAIRPRTTFEVSSFSGSRDNRGSQNSKSGSCDPHRTLINTIRQ